MNEPIQQRRTLWSPHHRVVFASSFGLRATDNDVGIDFATEQSVEGEEVLLSDVQVIMTPKSAKTLVLILQSVIAKLEEVGGEIPLTPGKAEEIASTLATQVRPG